MTPRPPPDGAPVRRFADSYRAPGKSGTDPACSRPAAAPRFGGAVFSRRVNDRKGLQEAGFLQCRLRKLVHLSRPVPCEASGARRAADSPDLHRRKGRQPVDDLEKVLRQCKFVEAHLRRESGPDPRCRPDPAGLEAPDARMSRKENDVPRRISRVLPALVLGLLLPVFACKKSETSTASSPATAPVSATESAPAAVRVTDVQIGKALGADKKIPAPTDTFAPKDTIFVSVATDGAAPSATIYAKWTYRDGQTVKTDSRTI